MSQERVDVYFAAKDRLAAGDHDGFTRLIHPDVTATVTNFPEPGPFLGRDALIAQLESLAIEFDGQRYSDVEIIADRDDWIVLTYRWSVQGSRSGVGVDADIAVAFRVKDRQLIEVHWRESRDEALDAAGLGKWAMSQENVDVVRALLEAFNKGDVDAMLGLATDDVDVRPPSHLLDGIVFRGHAGTRAWMERAAETWRELEVVSAQLLGTVREHVVMAQDVRSTGHDSGVPVEHRYIYVYTLRDGKVAAAIAYSGETDALEAAGLRA